MFIATLSSKKIKFKPFFSISNRTLSLKGTLNNVNFQIPLNRQGQNEKFLQFFYTALSEKIRNRGLNDENLQCFLMKSIGTGVQSILSMLSMLTAFMNIRNPVPMLDEAEAVNKFFEKLYSSFENDNPASKNKKFSFIKYLLNNGFLLLLNEKNCQHAFANLDINTIIETLKQEDNNSKKNKGRAKRKILYDSIIHIATNCSDTQFVRLIEKADFNSLVKLISIKEFTASNLRTLLPALEKWIIKNLSELDDGQKDNLSNVLKPQITDLLGHGYKELNFCPELLKFLDVKLSANINQKKQLRPVKKETQFSEKAVTELSNYLLGVLEANIIGKQPDYLKISYESKLNRQKSKPDTITFTVKIRLKPDVDYSRTKRLKFLKEASSNIIKHFKDSYQIDFNKNISLYSTLQYTVNITELISKIIFIVTQEEQLEFYVIRPLKKIGFLWDSKSAAKEFSIDILTRILDTFVEMGVYSCISMAMATIGMQQKETLEDSVIYKYLYIGINVHQLISLIIFAEQTKNQELVEERLLANDICSEMGLNYERLMELVTIVKNIREQSEYTPPCLPTSSSLLSKLVPKEEKTRNPQLDQQQQPMEKNGPYFSPLAVKVLSEYHFNMFKDKISKSGLEDIIEVKILPNQSDGENIPTITFQLMLTSEDCTDYTYERPEDFLVMFTNNITKAFPLIEEFTKISPSCMQYTATPKTLIQIIIHRISKDKMIESLEKRGIVLHSRRAAEEAVKWGIKYIFTNTNSTCL